MKTLKDLIKPTVNSKIDYPDIFSSELKQLAVEWVKKLEKRKIEEPKVTNAVATKSEIDILMDFFDLDWEDLK